MNSTIYIFGNLKGEFTLYPDNSAIKIFQKQITMVRSVTQIVTHREGDLLYYSYIRKLQGWAKDNPKYIGIVLLLNGVMITDVDLLFSFFEEQFKNMAFGNEIIGIDDNGNIVPMCYSIMNKKHEVDRITKLIKKDISNMEKYFTYLSPLCYEISIYETYFALYNEGNERLTKLIAKYPYVCINKSDNYNTEELSEYLSQVSQNYSHPKNTGTNIYHARQVCIDAIFIVVLLCILRIIWPSKDIEGFCFFIFILIIIIKSGFLIQKGWGKTAIFLLLIDFFLSFLLFELINS